MMQNNGEIPFQTKRRFFCMTESNVVNKSISKKKKEKEEEEGELNTSVLED